MIPAALVDALARDRAVDDERRARRRSAVDRALAAAHADAQGRKLVARSIRAKLDELDAQAAAQRAARCDELAHAAVDRAWRRRRRPR